MKTPQNHFWKKSQRKPEHRSQKTASKFQHQDPTQQTSKISLVSSRKHNPSSTIQIQQQTKTPLISHLQHHQLPASQPRKSRTNPDTKIP